MKIAINFQHIDPARGGAETYVADLCRGLVARGCRVEVYAESCAEGALPAGARHVQVESKGATRGGRIMSFARRSAAVLEGAEHDCVVGLINTWRQDVLIPQGGVRAASLEANARRFATPAGRALYRLGKRIQPKFGLYRAIEERQYDLARETTYVAVSAMVKRDIERFHNVPGRRIQVVPNAIDAGRLAVPQPAATRCALRNRLGLEPSDLAALFVGHNFALKGLSPLLRALALRRERNPGSRPIRLLVCGGGKSGPFRSLAARLGLGDSIRWVGFLPEIREAYWASDFFVSPTYYDPCSLVVFEALACGLPVVTTACNGAGELITQGREGFVATSPDALVELSQAFEHLADDGARALMSRHATELGRAQSFDRHVDRMLRVFEDAAAQRARGPRPAASQPHLGTNKKSRKSLFQS